MRLTTFSCLRSCRILISLRAVIGNYIEEETKTWSATATISSSYHILTPSFSFSISTFLSATIFLDRLCRALKTSPKVPWPIFAIFSYLFTSSQKGNSSSSRNFSRSLGFIEVKLVVILCGPELDDFSSDILTFNCVLTLIQIKLFERNRKLVQYFFTTYKNADMEAEG